MSDGDTRRLSRDQTIAVAAAFFALFAIVGCATYGLPFFYDFFFRDLGWTRQHVTSGNAYSKIAAALAFGLVAGVIVDTFGPRRLMLLGIVMAGAALVGLSTVTSSAFCSSISSTSSMPWGTSSAGRSPTRSSCRATSMPAAGAPWASPTSASGSGEPWSSASRPTSSSTSAGAARCRPWADS